MPLNASSLFVRPAAHAIATGLSFSIGGPLAAVTGAFVGGFLGESAVEFTRIATEKLAEAAGEGLLGDKLGQLAESLKPLRPGIESVHRNALRETLSEIGREARPAFSDWFRNWNVCLDSGEPLDPKEFSLERIIAANPDDLFRESLERLNAQGASIRARSLDLGSVAEPALLKLVHAGVSQHFQANFNALLAEPENEKLWKQAQQELQLANNRLLRSISAGVGAVKEGVVSANEKLDEVLRLLARLGLTSDVIAGLLDAAPSGKAAEQQTRIKELANQLSSTREAVTGFLSILKEDEVPLEQLQAKLALIAQRHVQLLDRLAALDPEDAEASRLIEQAREILVRAKSSADYDAADALLSQAEEAQNRTLHQAEELEREAKDAARRLRAGAAATRAERAELSLTRLNYLQAAAHFRAASEAISSDDARKRWEYLLRSADALKSHGDEMGDNAVLKRAIEVYRDVLSQTPRERVPLDWAATQNNLGNALSTLGERESGTARLEEAVAAYRAALEEWTRERVPLDWAMTQNNLGNALRALGARESGTARLEEAVAAYRAALEERTRERVPLQWAMTQNNLGNALRTLGARESGTARLEEAVAAFRAALEERTRERVPLNWATTQNNLGAALSTLGERESGTARLEEAVAAYRAALEEWTRERVPLDWAATQNNLGAALKTLGERESGTERLEEAAAALGNAWKVYREAGIHQYDDGFSSRLKQVEALIASRRGA